MTSAAEPVALDPRAQAEALAGALRDNGLTATVLIYGGHQQHPCVEITGGRDWRGNEIEWVYAAPEDGHWWFWWSSLELIAPVSEVSIAADVIARAFTVAGS
jgi:hypothetical protein